MNTRSSRGGSLRGRGQPVSSRTPAVANAGSKRGASSRGSTHENKRLRQDDNDEILTRSDIPTIVSAVLDASRSESGTQTVTSPPPRSSAATPPSSSSSSTAPPRSTPPDAATNTHPTAADEMQHQELGKQ